MMKTQDTIAIALAGTDKWTVRPVLMRDARGMSLGAGGAFGQVGAIVLIHFRQGNRELRVAARLTSLTGRYEFIQGAHDTLAARAIASNLLKRISA